MDFTYEPNIFDADLYLMDNVVDIEDWQGYEQEKRQRILNVSLSTLRRNYPTLKIPDQSVYEFIGVLSIFYNDINKYQHHGVAGYSITGVSSFNFKDSKIGESVDKYIPDSAKVILGEANNVNLLNQRRVGRTK